MNSINAAIYFVDSPAQIVDSFAKAGIDFVDSSAKVVDSFAKAGIDFVDSSAKTGINFVDSSAKIVDLGHYLLVILFQRVQALGNSPELGDSGDKRNNDRNFSNVETFKHGLSRGFRVLVVLAAVQIVSAPFGPPVSMAVKNIWNVYRILPRRSEKVKRFVK